MNTYSDCIYALIDFLKLRNVKLEQFAEDLPKNIVGRADYKKRLIKMRFQSAKEYCFALAHEIGHWLSYERYYEKMGLRQDNFSIERREEFAYLYGWYALKQVGGDVLITKEAWKDFHKEAESNRKELEQ